MTAKAELNRNIDNTLREKNSTSSILTIALMMMQLGLAEKFVRNVVRCAFDFEGAADLMLLWAAEQDAEERNEIIADLQELIEDSNAKIEPEELYIKLNNLELIVKHNRSVKDALYNIVNSRGGISWLAERTGIPQPSLSRFFNSSSKPRRSTLLAIGEALGITELNILSN